MSGVVVDTGAGNVRQRRQLDTVARLHTTLRRSRRRWHMTQNRRLNAHTFCTTVVIYGWRRRSVVRTSVFAGSLSLTCVQSLWQWRRLHGHGRGTCPHFYKWLGTGGTVSKRTANKKLTELYWPSWKRSPKRLIVLLEPKSGGAQPKKFFPALCAGLVPLHSLRTCPPQLSNSFRYHWSLWVNCQQGQLHHSSISKWVGIRVISWITAVETIIRQTN